MFLVANTTNRAIIINELNLSLGVKQAIDLHKVNLAMNPDKSGELRVYIKSGSIKVLKQDSKKSKKIKDSKKIVNNTINTIDQEELVKSIAAMVKQEVSNQNKDNQEIMKAISGLSSLVKNQKSTVIVQGQSQDEVVSKKKREELDLDQETLVQIHKRSMDNMTKKAEGNLEYEDQEITDDTMEEDLSLLEDLF